MATKRKQPDLKIESKPQPELENKWIKLYGNKKIEFAFETPAGWIWLIGEEIKKEECFEKFREGLVKICEAEWGYIDLNEIKELQKSAKSDIFRPFPIFKNELPCTLRELFEITPVSSYFIS